MAELYEVVQWRWPGSRPVIRGGVIVRWDGPMSRPTNAEIAQAVIDYTPPTPQAEAQATIDRYPIEVRALVLALVDQLNLIRAELPTPRPPITPAAALAAIRAKAGTLS